MALDPGSPLGTLVFLVVFALIFIFVFGTKNVYKDPDHRPRSDYTKWSVYSDAMRCPECGSKDVKFDTTQMLNPPVMVTCNDCNHEWLYVPPRI